MDALKLRFAVLRLFLGIVPRNTASLVTGRVARWRLPAIFQAIANSLFIKAFRLNMGEAHPAEPGAYASIEDLFIRRLRPGIRPVQSRYVSPADGYLAWSAPLHHGAAIQAKGIDYNPAELIWGKGADSREREPGELSWFTTVYLAPHNYHRVHSPVAGTIREARYIPGDLWPVNDPFVRFLPDLFLRNERLVFDLELAGGTGMRAYVVMVGAFNVGRMTTHLIPGFATNDQWFREISRDGRQKSWSMEGQAAAGSHPVTVDTGEELGAFLLGSTVVIVLNKAAEEFLKPVKASGNKPVMMGHALNSPN
ncbi:phosphatidylserine decarboxylase [bacterium]|nr:phosphatidylserine decarboxylase [bacterium]